MKPCDECEIRGEGALGCPMRECVDKAYALGGQKIAWEIVEWLKQPEAGSARHIRQGRRRLTANEIEHWLTSKGIDKGG
jgi:hypothetical protein